MTTILDIKAAIKQLPEKEVHQLAAWLQTYLETDRWDLQMETDLASGKLDNIIAKAEADIAANQVRHIDEVLDNS
ncbi:MAG: hypothetical protein GDA56_32580 [Hormoscilla sp. GM7CHS1pb]|nr:hypothetical protein [Hormoscilla sp. GM7CHS1pb]